MKILRFLFILLLIASCSSKEKHPYTFYYWKTNLKLDPEEKGFLTKHRYPFCIQGFSMLIRSMGNFNL